MILNFQNNTLFESVRPIMYGFRREQHLNACFEVNIFIRMLKFQVDNVMFSVRIKEAPSWTLYISSYFPKCGSENGDPHGPCEDG